jgi:hypothetical protein
MVADGAYGRLLHHRPWDWLLDTPSSEDKRLFGCITINNGGTSPRTYTASIATNGHQVKPEQFGTDLIQDVRSSLRNVGSRTTNNPRGCPFPRVLPGCGPGPPGRGNLLNHAAKLAHPARYGLHRVGLAKLIEKATSGHKPRGQLAATTSLP